HRLPRRAGGAHHRLRDHVPRGEDDPLRPGAVGEDRRGPRGSEVRAGQALREHRRGGRTGAAARPAPGRGRASAHPARRARHRDHGGAVTAPDPEPAPETAPPGEASSDAAGAPRHRTHPITPLVTGWKIVVGIIAVLTAQNIARLLEDFTLQRALIGLAAVAAAVVIAIVLSALSWWFTTYAVDDHGVSLHRGMISKSREYAPRARIESVSVERPLLARLLGLAKVRVEVAGGGESYLDIEYVRSADAEELRRRVLGVAALASAPEAGDAADSEPRPAAAQDPAAAAEGTGPAGAAPAGGTAAEQADATGASAAPWSADGRTGADAAPATASGVPLTADAAPGADGAATGSGLEALLYDGVTDGELIAKIPTDRLVRSLLRDLGFVFGTLASILGVGFAIVVGIWQEGINIAMIIALFPAFIAVPKFVF